MTFAERQQAEWAEKYAGYTEAMLQRRIGTLDKQIATKSRAAEVAKWDRRGKGQRLQSTREQRASHAGQQLRYEQNYVRALLAKKREDAAASKSVGE